MDGLMTAAAPAAQRAGSAPRRALLATRALFTLTAFFGAALLFVVQPMVARLLLPSYGGSATVWSTSSLFFQVLLLTSYFYVHVSRTRLRPRVQPLVHAALVAVPLTVLPVVLPAGAAPGDGSPVLWLLRTLTLMVGLPFLVVGTAGPVLQAWFAETADVRSHDPYFLFAASNLGSFGGLLAYPFLIEPHVSLHTQRLAWSWGFVAFAALTVGCAVVATRGASRTPERRDEAAGPKGRVPARTLLRWTLLAFLPASLSLAITSHLSTDVGAIPLLWVVPLAVYLATFVTAFSRTTRQVPRRATYVAATVAVVGAAAAPIGGMPIWLMAGIDLVLLATVGYAAHARLAADRPPPEHLTTFYLVIAAGGALGGFLNGFVAPLVFDRVLEFPLTLVLVSLLFVGIGANRGTVRSLLILLGGLLLVLAAAAVVNRGEEWRGTSAYVALAVLAAAVGWGLTRAPILLALCLVAPFVATWWGTTDTIDRTRSFYGAYRVEQTADQHKLVHGNTVHGAQFRDERRRDTPTTYYASPGSVGDVFELFGDRLDRVGTIGLGAGTIAAYGRPGQRMTFFEIDPDIVHTARDPRLFTFLTDSKAAVDVVVGDGRLEVAKLPSGSLDLLVLDAFSSDSIPVHLLTREAFAMYADRLADGGILAVHISSRFFDLVPVLAAAAEDLGWTATIGLSQGSTPGATSSRWVVLSADRSVASQLAARPRWEPLDLTRRVQWTDDYSSVLSVLGQPG
ncbi:fused MFS/spermidine synthase [Nocardioides pocheonensis]|uniref:Spermidine synthase n=1 Tax=Nocardioides pocheonensis TaxID=661485 RepID=A0A3N0GGN2_9ACTN|nr:fused MFS/spermidine synthase [Nocardioides pocheonensis]RNM11624.1 hypothetical protein EFL26_20865 [Nocardioides pocheonensis]